MEGMGGAPGWVGVRDACRILGVHEATLRRWSDRGLVPFFRTPGGHRRYRRAELASFLAQRQTGLAGWPFERLARETLWGTRRELEGRLPAEAWRGRYRSREGALRESGRELLGLLIHHVAREDDEGRHLDRARAIMARYGREALEVGLSVVETARAVQVFRQAILQAVVHAMHRPVSGDPEGWRVLRRAGAFFDDLLLSALQGYVEAAGAPQRDKTSGLTARGADA